MTVRAVMMIVSFSKALLSARQKLYISYVGRSIQDNTERVPSVWSRADGILPTQLLLGSGLDSSIGQQLLAWIRQYGAFCVNAFANGNGGSYAKVASAVNRQGHSMVSLIAS